MSPPGQQAPAAAGPAAAGVVEPADLAAAAAAITALGETRRPVVPRGHGSRSGAPAAGSTVLSTRRLTRILEHNPGDFTAVLEAGVPIADAQAAFAVAGQWLPLDPPPGGTIGGLVAAADSGPARHRYGGVRDLVLGATVVLSDGLTARSGGRVIKNVAGYDLGKLFAGSHGTLGLIAGVSVRLHPLPTRFATVVGAGTDPDGLAAAALGLARRPLEATALDVHWRAGAGRLLVRFSGSAAPALAAGCVRLLDGLDQVGVVDGAEEDALWTEQRAGQRAPDGMAVTVSGRPTDLPGVLRAADAVGATVVSRVALGLSWLTFGPAPEVVTRLRAELAPRAVTVRDGADRLGTGVSAWPEPDPGALAVMSRVKARFDPARIFRPGAFVGGL